MRTYPQALVYALLVGLGSYAGMAAGSDSTVWEALPYGVAVVVAIALAGSAVVAYRNRPPGL